MTVRALPPVAAPRIAGGQPETPATGVTLLDSKGRSVAVRASSPGAGAADVPTPVGSRLDALRKASEGLGAKLAEPLPLPPVIGKAKPDAHA